MKTKEFKDMKNEETKKLLDLVAKKKLELIQNTVKLLGSKEKNVKRGKILKKEIAQILSVLSGRKESKI